MFDAIRGAQREVLIETFILFDDKVGRELRDVLIEAAQRGVRVDLTVDGYGSPDLSDDFIGGLDRQPACGCMCSIRAPGCSAYRLKLFRRLHRKMVVVDGALAFVGGINYSADHLGDFGPEAKQDYAVKVEGPLVAQIHRLARAAAADRSRAGRSGARRRPPPSCRVPATRRRCWSRATTTAIRNDIERHYRAAIRTARREVIIANAYFFPGYRLLNEMRKAARRGVKVTLIVQGKPDMQIVSFGARPAVSDLLAAGVVDPRVLPAAAARQGGAGGRRVVPPSARATSTR